MLNLLVRLLLLAAAGIASWFVAYDQPNFSVVQMVVALILFGLVVFGLALWPRGWWSRLGRRGR